MVPPALLVLLSLWFQPASVEVTGVTPHGEVAWLAVPPSGPVTFDVTADRNGDGMARLHGRFDEAVAVDVESGESYGAEVPAPEHKIQPGTNRLWIDHETSAMHVRPGVGVWTYSATRDPRLYVETAELRDDDVLVIYHRSNASVARVRDMRGEYPPLYLYSAGHVRVAEGQRTATITLKLTQPAPHAVMVELSRGTRVTFAPGETEKRIDVLAGTGTPFTVSVRSITGAPHFFSDTLVMTEPSRKRRAAATAESEMPPQAGLSSSPHSIVATPHALFFIAYDGEADRVFVSDGTAAGTRVVRDDVSPRFDTPLIVDGDFVYFTTWNELWRTDGTAAGTKVIATSENLGDDIRFRFALGRRIVYTTNSTSWSVEEGGVPVRLDRYVGQSVVRDGVAYFTSQNGIWRTDGTPAGTRLVHADNGVFFFGDAGESLVYTTLREAFALTPEGQVTPIPLEGSTGRPIMYYYIIAGRLWIATFDGVWVDGRRVFAGSTGYVADAGDGVLINTSDGLYASDGGPAVKIGDLGGSGGAALPDGSVLFRYTTDDGDDALWRTDFTAAGTRLVRDINPRGRSDIGSLTMAAFRGRVYFSANDGMHGEELWRSNGTSKGTEMAVNFRDEAAIAGHVLDAGTAKPLAGITVEAYQLIGRRFYYRTDAVSDAQGRFRIEGVAGGAHVLRTRNGGIYADRVFGGTACPPCVLATGVQIHTTVSQTVEDIDIRLDRGGRISGTLRTQSGAAVPNTEIAIESEEGGVAAIVRSDAEGRWAAGGLASGVYVARVGGRLYDGRPVTVDAPKEVTGIQIVH